ncbi:thiamine pyrophosphate-binding protein [Bradyrhizobium sp.]|uniref:thiamine pyrophosphate-binding protein n=1 Tax=Bradyrhizobium sp. TaxID=376 RepID=UPI0039E60FCC
MTMMSGGQAVVDVLKAEGVKFVFGMPGGHTIGIYDALYGQQQISHILVRHEQHAASMAAGYAQLTGQPGVCCVTAGPGATNLVTSVAEAYVGALPMVIIAGRGATRNAHRGASQEIDQVRIFAAITKWGIRVDRPDLIVESLRQAFTIARSGKPGPVLIDIPQDVLAQQVDLGDYRPVGKPAAVRGDSERIKAAAAALLAAKRPLILAGGGAVAADASAEVRRLAEALGSPVLTTLAGRGILPDDHELVAGGIGHHRQDVTKFLLPNADVVIGIGARFEQQETNWKPDYLPAPTATYIQIDIDPNEIGRSVVAGIGITGDARLVLRDLNAEIEGQSNGQRAASKEWLDELARRRAQLEAEREAMANSDAKPIHPVRIFDRIRRVFPRNTTVAIDVGVLAQGMGGAYPYFKIYEPRATIVPSSFYGMGFSASAFPVAKLVYPDRPAVCFVGDGSFQMVMNILPVAAELKLGVTWCIFNDHALGSIRDIQVQAFNERFIATDFVLDLDYAGLAVASGCHGERVSDPQQIEAALERAVAANAAGKPAVIDFVVAKERLKGSMEFFAR